MEHVDTILFANERLLLRSINALQSVNMYVLRTVLQSCLHGELRKNVAAIECGTHHELLEHKVTHSDNAQSE